MQAAQRQQGRQQAQPTFNPDDIDQDLLDMHGVGGMATPIMQEDSHKVEEEKGQRMEEDEEDHDEVRQEDPQAGPQE